MADTASQDKIDPELRKLLRITARSREEFAALEERAAKFFKMYSLKVAGPIYISSPMMGQGVNISPDKHFKIEGVSNIREFFGKLVYSSPESVMLDIDNVTYNIRYTASE